MDYALKLNQFEELNYKEMLEVDGGYDFWTGMYHVLVAFLTAVQGTVEHIYLGPWGIWIGFTEGYYYLLTC